MVANGQGEMKGKLFRIAHLGYYDYLDTIGILARWSMCSPASPENLWSMERL